MRTASTWPRQRRYKIPVTVIPVIAVSEATADLHFGLMLAVARRIVEGDRLVRAGYFPGAQSNYLAGAWVWGKVLGLVGGKGQYRPSGGAARARVSGCASSIRARTACPRPTSTISA